MVAMGHTKLLDFRWTLTWPDVLSPPRASPVLAILLLVSLSSSDLTRSVQ